MPHYRKILVVDDNEDVRAKIVHILQSRGFTVDSAKNGRDALAKLERMGPTLILLDLMMPRMSGWQFVESHNSDAKFEANRVVTISAVNEDLDDIQHLEVAGRLQKPVTLSALMEVAHKFCDEGNQSDSCSIKSGLSI